MNQTVLNITDFQPMSAISMQIIDSKEINIEKLFQHSLQTNENQDFYIITPDPKEYLKKIKKKLTVIKAAGGIVQNKDGDYLFIHRLGKWDLPKGKLDAGEDTETASIREVEEECGIQVKPKIRKLTATYHLYMYKNKLTIKKTTWFSMRVSGRPNLVPQLEESITDARWFSSRDLAPIRSNTYRLIDGLIEEYISTPIN